MKKQVYNVMNFQKKSKDTEKQLEEAYKSTDICNQWESLLSE